MLFCDIETRSQCDLLFHGLRRYAQDPSTELVCLAYAFDLDPVQFMWAHEPLPDDLRAYLEGDGEITAHNAQFERDLFDFVICNDYDLPLIAPTRWRCSMVQALTNGHPGALVQLGESLGLPIAKQSEGPRLIREYCAPQFADIFVSEDRDVMQQYCEYDVEVMRAAVSYMRPLTDDEWAEYHLTEKMNDKGIPVDVPFAEAVLGYSEEIAADASAEIARITGGAMTKHTQRKARDEFVLPRLTDHQTKLITVIKKGKETLSFDRDCRGYLLDCDDLDLGVYALLEQIDNAGSSSLTKFAVAAHTHVDGLVHHTLQFNGAQTGRYTSRGLQIHNMVRDAYGEAEADELAAQITEGFVIDAPAKTMARLARSMIRSDEGVYFVDYSAIEGRVAPWITDDPLAQDRLEVFRNGGDIYVKAAQDMFGLVEVDDQYRQTGKVAELSLGYGGAVGALTRMAKNFGITFEQTEAEDIVSRWRTINKWATGAWEVFEDAAYNAVNNPGEVFKAGRCAYRAQGQYLWCGLPSGRWLAYAKPEIEFIEDNWGARYKATFQTTARPGAGEERIRKPLRGALLFQNICQAVAADLLRDALLRADEAGLDIRWHVHDEICGLGPPEDGEKLNEIMLTAPAWAAGLPLATGGVSSGRRYGK